jgi:hypothetical protein
LSFSTARAAALLATGAVLALPVLGAGPAEAAPARKFANCTDLNRAHPHGVGKPGARDRASGTPVTTFLRNAALYAANAGSDRDKDGIACEKA